MKVIYIYGKANDKSKDSQNVNIRVFHGRDLDYRGSLGWEVNKKDWDFIKKDIADLNKGVRSHEEYKYLSEVKADLYKIRASFEAEYRTAKRTRRTFNKEEWSYWCREIIFKALGGEKEEREKLIDKMEEYVELLQLREATPGTIKGWIGKIKAIKRFQEYRKQVIYTDQVDLALWYELKKWCIKSGIQGNTFGDYIKKIKATILHFRSLSSEFKYSPQIDHKDFKAEYTPRVGNILTPEDIEKIYNYKGEKDLENVSKLAFIQYNMCWRISDLFKELKAYKKGEAEIHFNKDLKRYEWQFKEQKKKKLGAVSVPVNKRVYQMLQDDEIELIVDAEYNEQLKVLLTKLGITKANDVSSHDLRKSFCTNMFNASHSLQDIMQFSGHKTESSLLIYINKRTSKSRVNNIPLD